jgi:hypothetical protein
MKNKTKPECSSNDKKVNERGQLGNTTSYDDAKNDRFLISPDPRKPETTPINFKNHLLGINATAWK